MSTVSVVIVTRNRRAEVTALLSDLAGVAAAAGDEIILVDNGSADGTVEHVRLHFPGIVVIGNTENRGAPAARNTGVAAARGGTLVFLDDDTRVEDPEFLGKVRRLFETEREAEVVAFRILDPVDRKSVV